MMRFTPAETTPTGNKTSPFKFASDSQYAKYLECLRSKGIAIVSADGRFTPEQLRCAEKAFGQCPPGYESQCSRGVRRQRGYDTPIMNPAPGVNPFNDPHAKRNPDGTVTSKNHTYTYRNGKYISNYGNSTTPGVPNMGGFSFMPSTFKPASAKRVDPNRFGFSAELTDDRYVNTSVQRISGGAVVPVTNTITVMDRTPRQISSTSLADEPWAENIKNLEGLNTTNKNYVYTPAKVSSVVNLGGKTINNTNYSATTPNADGTITGPAGNWQPGVNSTGLEGTNTITADGNAVANDFVSFDNTNIRYNEYPLVSITPLIMDVNGNYIPAGNTAEAPLTAPAPTLRISANDLPGVNDGEELILNGAKIVLRGAGSLLDIKQQVNCSRNNLTAKIIAESGGGTGTLSITSCDGQAITIRNGCGAGRLRQIADFHINRGFEQSRDKSNSLTDVIFMPVSSLNSKSTPVIKRAGKDASTTYGYSKTDITNEYLSTTPFVRYDYDIDSHEFTNFQRGTKIANLDLDTPSIRQLPTETEIKRFTTGGSGYRIGDRLRLVGGLAVNNSMGPLTHICIDSAGAGITNPTDVDIIINPEGKTPGFGASAQVVSLDENGGIAEVAITSWGTGYDVENPPEIKVVNRAVNPTFVDIDTAWTGDIASDSYPAGSYFKFILKTDIKGLNGESQGIEKENLYAKSIAPLSFGGVRTTNISTVSPVVSNVLRQKNRVQLDFNSSDFKAYLRNNSILKIVHHPLTLLLSQQAEHPLAAASPGNNIRITANQTILNNWVNQGEHRVAIYRLDVTDYTPKIYGHADGILDNGAEMEFVNFQPIVPGNTLTIADVIYASIGTETSVWVPDPLAVDPTTPEAIIGNNSVIVESPHFTDATAVSALFPENTLATMSASKPWGFGGTVANIVAIADPTIPYREPKLSGRIAMDPTKDPGSQSMKNPLFADGFKSFAGPPRVAKFIVTSIDQYGGITGLRCIDRGLYKEMPQDLPYGIPLEYDYHNVSLSPSVMGAESPTGGSPSLGASIGIQDPARDNIGYDSVVSDNPIYGYTPFKNGKHPDWASFAEYKWVPVSDSAEFVSIVDDYFSKLSVNASLSNTAEQAERQAIQQNGGLFVPFYGSPGAYDPGTWVYLNLRVSPGQSTRIQHYLKQTELADKAAQGLLVPKEFQVNFDPLDLEFGEFTNLIAGGTGARLFITQQEVPSCTEKGQAKETLGLPDQIDSINAPEHLADLFNSALQGAGYDPDDISFGVRPLGDLGILELNPTDYPGVSFDGTPGALELLGIPAGDYNLDMLCIEATLDNPNLTNNAAINAIEDIYSNSAFGLLSNEAAASLTGIDPSLVNPGYIINLVCANRLGPGGEYNGPRPLNDNNSLFGDANAVSVSELYKYDITNIYGQPVSLGGTDSQGTSVNYFESKRFNATNPMTGQNLSSYDQAWIDDLDGNGWAYVERGVIKRRQGDMVDVNQIENAIVYDAETGERTTDLHFYDPFKGVLPKFIANEIDFISERDPVSYTSARTNWGKANVGKVWWDTSTIAYTWYEQGSNTERAANWGRAFPGSSVTVCEWVESEALPQNWTGNGMPRWRDRYVIERRPDPRTGEYKLYYYYWVQNRTVVDDRVRESMRRELDTQTIARYIANPVGYGLNTISFVSQDSFIINNAATAISDNDDHIQINFTGNDDVNSIAHSAWKLIREGDDVSDVPDHISDKLIDSLCGSNSLGQPVPDPRLSEVEKYGIGFRPRQGMFKDVREARRVMASTLNEMLADIKLYSQHPEWDAGLPETRNFVKRTSWYAVDRVNPTTNANIRFNSTYKPVYKVSSVAELYRLRNLPDGTVVQVQGTNTQRPELWMYRANEINFRQIAIADETVQLDDSVFTTYGSLGLSVELRALLVALRDDVFYGTELWNVFFFQMLKYAYMEQKQLDWAFKTSYLYIEKEEQDLVQFNGFKPDNFQKVLDYMNEVKPFNAKIREYRDGKSSPVEIIGRNQISDFDKPPYVDFGTNEIRILDDTNATDIAIMESDIRYSDYITITDKSQDPIRKGLQTIRFDRTNWQLTEFAWDKSTEPANYSIAKNIARLSTATGREVELATTTRAVDRIFKFDPAVKATFAAEINYYFNDVSAYSNVSIVGNTSVLYEIINEGRLNNTLALVKDKVGGNFWGEELDAKRFNRFLEDIEYANLAITEFGYDSQPWDNASDNNLIPFNNDADYDNYGPIATIGIGDQPWDTVFEIANYEGIFNTDTQGNIALRRNDTDYEGFDGVTFQRVLYGEERPEELALFSPFESLVMTVTTNELSLGDNGQSFSSSAATVKFRQHLSLFGNTDYMRMLKRNRTTLATDVYATSGSIELAEASFLPQPTPLYPGYVWIGTEKVKYNRMDGNTISVLTRGVHGTTLEDWPAGTEVYLADESEYFKPNELDDRRSVWLDLGNKWADPEGFDADGPGAGDVWDNSSGDSWDTAILLGGPAKSLADRANIDYSDKFSIMLFLHDLDTIEYSYTEEVPDPTYTLIVDNNTPNEGDTVTATFGTNQNDGTYYWYINHGTTEAADFVTVMPGPANRQPFTVSGGYGTITFDITEDLFVEGEETFTLGVSSTETSATVVAQEIRVQNTSVEEHEVVAVPNPANEGNTITFTYTTNQPDGTYYWYINHVSTEDDDFTTVPPKAVLPEAFTVTGGTGTFSITLRDDLRTEGDEQFEAHISKTLIAESEAFALVDVLDTSQESYVLTVNTTTPSEGSLVQFQFQTNQADGPTYYWWIEHDTSSDADFTEVPPSSGNRTAFTTSAGTHQFGLIIDNDSVTEGVESFNVFVSNSETGLPIVQSDVAIEIQDTSIEIVVLDAGEDQFVIGTDTASLNGFYSSDLTGKTVTWVQLTGDETVVIDDANSLDTFFTIPSGALTSTITMRLYIDQGLPGELFDDVNYFAQAFSGTTPPSSEIGSSNTGLSVNPNVGE